jgi:hypothetical protein
MGHCIAKFKSGKLKMLQNRSARHFRREERALHRQAERDLLARALGIGSGQGKSIGRFLMRNISRHLVPEGDILGEIVPEIGTWAGPADAMGRREKSETHEASTPCRGRCHGSVMKTPGRLEKP